jgi:hypothetical protein
MKDADYRQKNEVHAAEHVDHKGMGLKDGQ